jgi:peptide/nickel transport system permease protein
VFDIPVQGATPARASAGHSTMQRYITQRLTLFIPTLIIVSIIIFAIMRVLPGNVAVLILVGPGGENRYSAEEVQQVEKRLGLDQPLPVQYLRWVGDVMRLDFGESVVQNSPVVGDVLRRFTRVTLELALLTMMIALAIAIPSGVIQAVYQNSIADYVLRFITIGGIAMPGFVFGSLLLIAAVRYFGWLPPLGYVPFWDDPITNLKQMILPALTLGYILAASTARMVRSSMLEVLREDYVRTARAKGLRDSTVIVRHAVRNGLLPVITIVGAQIGGLLGGTVIAETLFNLPGVGRTAIDAINNRDYPLVQFIVLMYAVIFMTVNLLVDLAYGAIDPRIRYG